MILPHVICMRGQALLEKKLPKHACDQKAKKYGKDCGIKGSSKSRQAWLAPMNED